jgi:hypothetical protein
MYLPSFIAEAVTSCRKAAAASGLEYALVSSVDVAGLCINASESSPIAGLISTLRVLFERGGIVMPLTPLSNCSDATELLELLHLAESAGTVTEPLSFDSPSSWALGSMRHGAAVTRTYNTRQPRAWAASRFNHDIFRLLVALTFDSQRSPKLTLALDRSIDGVHARVTLAPLRVATHALWLNVGVVMDELWLLSDVTLRAVGRTLVPVNTALAEQDALASADVILIGGYGSRPSALAIARKYRETAITIFIASENTDGGPFDDQLIGEVAISFGHRREAPQTSAPEGAIGTAYLRLPWWLPYTVRRETGGCALPSLLYARTDPTAWRARPRFTALLSSHYSYPRGLLFNLTSSLGFVEAPGKAFHNSEWPAALPNHHLRGKVEYLSGFRFTVCPENSRTRGSGGYNTEKLAQAHLAGAVPIYWGDAIDTLVFNPARVIFFNDTNGDVVLHTMRRLQDDASFRAAWFKEPILAPTAGAWLEDWCATAAQHFRAAAEGTS